MLINILKLVGNKHNKEDKSIPLRIWTKDWSIPEKMKLEKYRINLNTSHQTNVNLDRYALWGEVETIKDFKKRVYGNKKPSQWGRGKKSGRRFDYKEKKGKILIKLLSKCPFFDIQNRIFYFDGKYLRMSLHKEELGLWYLSGDGQIRFIILPKFINLKEEFFELMGILDGEMCRKVNKKGGSSLKISNSEPIIIKKIVKDFENYFKINKNSWTCSLTVNNKDQKFDMKSDYNLKKFWSNKIRVPFNRFSKTTFQNKYRSLFSEKGIIQIRYSNTLFFITLLEIMKDLRSNILKNTEYCKAYIRGIAAAEGGIGKRKDKLRIVHIGGMNDEDKIFYSKCLSKIGITSIQKYKLRIEVCGLKNFHILHKIDIFKYHLKRKKAFLTALKNLSDSSKIR